MSNEIDISIKTDFSSNLHVVKKYERSRVISSYNANINFIFIYKIEISVSDIITLQNC